MGDSLSFLLNPVRRKNEIIFVVSDSAEGGYEGKALREAILTEANTLEELRTMVCEAVACHFPQGQSPCLIRLHFVREEVLAA